MKTIDVQQKTQHVLQKRRKYEQKRVLARDKIRAVFYIGRGNPGCVLRTVAGSYHQGRQSTVWLVVFYIVSALGGVELHLQPQIYLQIGKQRARCNAKSAGLLRCFYARIHFWRYRIGKTWLERLPCAGNFHGDKLCDGIHF